MNPDSPLGPEHLTSLDRVLERVGRTAQLLESCRNCDMDVEEPLIILNQQAAKAEKLKRTFFPDAT